MRVFISGKVGQEDDTQAVMSALTALGHVVTFDWTSIAHLRPYEVNREDSSRAAVEELAGVQSADVLVLLSHERGVGMFVELGAALALNKPVLVLTRGPMRTMFLAHPLVTTVIAVDDLLAKIDELARLSNSDNFLIRPSTTPAEGV
jgi:nucleoside 2-deoxyribosyltransferase-like protein